MKAFFFWVLLLLVFSFCVFVFEKSYLVMDFESYLVMDFERHGKESAGYLFERGNE